MDYTSQLFDLNDESLNPLKKPDEESEKSKEPLTKQSKRSPSDASSESSSGLSDQLSLELSEQSRLKPVKAPSANPSEETNEKPFVPLAEKHRPLSMDDLSGQNKIRKVLADLARSPRSVIFYGPPGCGKTTAAKIIARESGLNYLALNAIEAGVKEIKEAEKPCLIFLDEIQYFNKKQQQSLLPYMENGDIILIGATTESPWHTLNRTILSRASVITFEALSEREISDALKKAAMASQIQIEEEAINLIASYALGDMRLAYTTLDLALAASEGLITKQTIEDLLSNDSNRGFEDSLDDYYSLLSALQKSVRGSDPDAAVFYLCCLLESGGLESVCRRLLVMASEDVGLAYPQAISIVYAAVQSAREIGMPEAKFPLSNAVVLLASSPKSFSAPAAYLNAKKDFEAKKGRRIPVYLKRDQAPGYKWPHAYPDHYIPQQYLPDDLRNACYYFPDENKFEQQASGFLKKLKDKFRKG